MIGNPYASELTGAAYMPALQGFNFFSVYDETLNEMLYGWSITAQQYRKLASSVELIVLAGILGSEFRSRPSLTFQESNKTLPISHS